LQKRYARNTCIKEQLHTVKLREELAPQGHRIERPVHSASMRRRNSIGIGVLIDLADITLYPVPIEAPPLIEIGKPKSKRLSSIETSLLRWPAEYCYRPRSVTTASTRQSVYMADGSRRRTQANCRYCWRQYSELW